MIQIIIGTRVLVQRSESMALFIMDRFSLANLILEVKTVVLSALFSLQSGSRVQTPDVQTPCW